MPKSSQTLKDAKSKGLFKFEFVADKQTFNLDSGLVFSIKNAWVENRWKYECIDNRAEVVKDSSFQFVIDADYESEFNYADYGLESRPLQSVLDFDYTEGDTFCLNLYKDTSYKLTHNKRLVEKITFVKRQVSR